MVTVKEVEEEEDEYAAWSQEVLSSACTYTSSLFCRKFMRIQGRKLGNICDFACMLLHRAAVKACNSTFGL